MPRRWPWSRPARTAAVALGSPELGRVSKRTRQQWQARARFFASNMGVIRFANGITADLSSRVRLVPERLVDPARNEWRAEDEPFVASVIQSYGNERQSAAELIRSQVWHYKTVGEAYQTCELSSDGRLIWGIRSVQCVEWRTDSVLVRDVPGGSVGDGTARELPIDAIRRLWRPDDEWPGLATSPMKAIIADCERYWSLLRRIRREADSALLMNGLLHTPEAAHTYPMPNEQDPNARKVSYFDRDFYEVARRAWEDDDSADALAPFSVHYDSDQPPVWIKLGSPLDPNALLYLNEAIGAIGRGVDMPKRMVVDGEGEGNHWGSWLTEESYVKHAIAPTLNDILHDDLTGSVLRPILRGNAARGIWRGDPEVWRIGYDATDIIVHPDRASSAITLYPMGLIKGSRVLEENGFVADDLPSPQELSMILSFFQTRNARADQTLSPDPGRPNGNLPVGPGNVRELPPAPATASLAPYPQEVTAWLA